MILHPDWLMFTQPMLQNGIHSFISGMHHYAKFVAPNADISLQSGLWATSVASSRERLLDFMSCWIVFIHVVQGRPGGLLQFSKLLRSSWHLFHLVFTHCGQTGRHAVLGVDNSWKVCSPGCSSHIIILHMMIPASIWCRWRFLTFRMIVLLLPRSTSDGNATWDTRGALSWVDNGAKIDKFFNYCNLLPWSVIVNGSFFMLPPVPICLLPVHLKPKSFPESPHISVD